MNGRHGDDNQYRYGFQGQEKDDEIKGEDNSINFEYRMYSSQIGRFLSRDPLTKKYPWYTPYSFAGNKVIQFIELEGCEEGITKGDANNNFVMLRLSLDIGPREKTHYDPKADILPTKQTNSKQIMDRLAISLGSNFDLGSMKSSNGKVTLEYSSLLNIGGGWSGKEGFNLFATLKTN